MAMNSIQTNLFLIRNFSNKCKKKSNESWRVREKLKIVREKKKHEKIPLCHFLINIWQLFLRWTSYEGSKSISIHLNSFSGRKFISFEQKYSEYVMNEGKRFDMMRVFSRTWVDQ